MSEVARVIACNTRYSGPTVKPIGRVLPGAAHGPTIFVLGRILRRKRPSGKGGSSARPNGGRQSAWAENGDRTTRQMAASSVGDVTQRRDSRVRMWTKATNPARRRRLRSTKTSGGSRKSPGAGRRAIARPAIRWITGSRCDVLNKRGDRWSGVQKSKRSTSWRHVRESRAALGKAVVDADCARAEGSDLK